MYAKKNNGMKIVVTLLAVVLLIGCTAGATLAWLMDTTGPVTNTFTVGEVDIELNEHSYNTDDDNKVTTTISNTNNYPLIPGTSYGKDPKVTVLEDSEDCYLFIRIQEINNPSDYLDYEYNLDLGNEDESDDWILHVDEGAAGKVYYRTVAKGQGAAGWNLLKGDTTHATGVITVVDGIINAGKTPGEGEVNMPADNAQPQIIFTAYAVQKANLTVEDAWEQVDRT